ncbi:rho GTPase-activating protein 45-like isoform X2 [Homarus americanus]|uniref:rho GTPase-activating protein 45-like isoform X2 n=1 Tax=Homarus americanus TaxID=6706 RepID=UPI001C456518|nr:rho GTPase-activating protein 45-like isoform X2 [Homarus americanus]
MIEPIMTAVLLDNWRSNSLRQFPPKVSKMKLFKANSVPHVQEDILNGVGGTGGMEGAGGRAAIKVGGTTGSSTTSRGSSSSGSSGQGVGCGVVGVAMTSAGLTSSTQTLAVTSTPRSLSLASISSDGSSDSHLVEREDIVALTTAVRAFKEALGKLKRIFHPERDKNETLRVAAHERLGEVLRILRSILEKYSPIQHNELLAAASHLISHVNGFSYEDEQADPTAFLEAIDQLALAFSSRVSEYLMGDIDSSSAILNCSTASSRNKSCENLVSSDGESTTGERGGIAGAEGGCLDPGLKEPEVLTPQQIDEYLHRHEQGVEYALHRAKVWSKYAKDVMTYIEKRAQMDLEYARNLTKLAHTVRPALKEESFLPFQSIYCTALDQDIENTSQLSQTCILLQTHKFIEPLTTRRNEHERSRKVIKESWHKELKRVTEAVSNLKKSKVTYVQRHQELMKMRELLSRAEYTEGLEKLERKRDEAYQKAKEAETWYKTCVADANERHASLLKVKREVLVQARELILQCDQTMKAVTVGYFQLQHTVAAPAPVQLQTLCESSRLYEPGSQYMEFVKRLGPSLGQEQPETPFTFQPYTPGTQDPPNHDPTANGSMTSTDDLQVGGVGGHGGSDTDSVGSSHSAKSVDASPTASPLAPARRTHTISSGDELETDPDTADAHYNYGAARRQVMSKAAVTHTFRKLKTPSRCRECDSYVYFHGYECAECGLGCHKKCLETLAIQCGHKRLPRKMTTFGVDLAQHLCETNTSIPHLVVKCVAEIDARGTKIKGIYRVSGVKSRVEKLCQAFENGANLVDLTDQHPNVIANVLKLYLRQLPEPLLTFRLYPEFIRIAKECPTGGECGRTTEDLRDLVRRLPRHHFTCLALLMHHLHRVTLHAHLNNMPSSNLGIVFGPTLLRTSEGSASLSSLVDTVHQTRAIELLIMFANEIFGQPEHYQVPASARSLDEVLKAPTPRQTSVHTSSSSGVVNVAISGYKRPPSEMVGLAEDSPSTPTPTPTHPTPTPPPHHHAPKERKDSDVLEEDWDCENWEESGTEGGGVSDVVSSGPRGSSTRSTTAHAKIYKTSLRDYVGLEGVALHMSTGLHTAQDAVDVVHQKLRKTVSDISSSLRPPTTHDLPRRATIDEATRRGPQEDDRKHHDHPARRKAPEDPHRRHISEDLRRKATSEEVGRKSTTEELTRRGEDDRLSQQEDRPRQPQSTSGAMLARAQALYKSASKGSMSETELKVEVRASSGVNKGESRDASSQDLGTSTSSVPIPGTRRVSPHLGHRPSLGQKSGLTSGTDSSIDSDHSYDYGHHTHALTPSATHTSTPILPPRGRSELATSGASRGVSVSRDPSLDNVTSSVTSSDSSSQEVDSAHATEDSHSSEAADEPDTARTITYSSGCGGSSGGESGYVSPYLSTERGGLVTLGPSLLLTRSTIAQYDTKRTITTVVAPRSSFDENRVRIQVPAAVGGGASRGPTAVAAATSAVNIGAEATVRVSMPGQQQQGVSEGVEGLPSEGRASPLYTLRSSEAEVSSLRRLHPDTRVPGPPQSPASDSLQEHPRKPSPNRSPRFV